MKKIILKSVFALSSLMFISSCQKDEPKMECEINNTFNLTVGNIYKDPSTGDIGKVNFFIYDNGILLGEFKKDANGHSNNTFSISAGSHEVTCISQNSLKDTFKFNVSSTSCSPIVINIKN